MSITSSNTNRNAQKIRIVFLGDQGVGKSSIIDRFTTSRYEQTRSATVGIDFNVKDVCRNGQYYRLQMWDTAGQERYRSLIPTYLKNAQFAVFVYDVTRQNSLENLKMWHKLFKEHQEAPGIIVGNKIDLSNARKVSKEEAENLANQLKLKYFEVSAKTGKKIHDLFDEVLDGILTEIKKEQEFIESSREKVKDIKTNTAEGLMQSADQTKADTKQNVVSLKNKGEQDGKNVKCCSNMV